MKNKYIVPTIKVTFCSCEGYLLAGTTIERKSEVDLDGSKKTLEKTTENVDIGAKHFSAWDAWDD